MNIWMFLAETYPTYLYFIVMLVGGLLFGISFPLKRLRTFWQVVITLVPFIVSFIYFKANDASHDIFFIPEGFRGQIIVLYGQHNGEPKEFDGQWRIYRIPKSGILKTQFELKGHVLNLGRTKYFFVDNQGNKTVIPTFCEYCDSNIKDTTSVQIIYGTLDNMNIGKYQDFFVDIPIIHFNEDKLSKLDSLKREKSGR